MTQRERVLAMLKAAHGPVCGNRLDDVVGRRFGARIHELRWEHGYVIESAPCHCVSCNRRAKQAQRDKRPFTRSFAYRLVAQEAAA